VVTAAPPTFRPRSDLLHVRLLTPAAQTSGGVWLPETARTNSEEGEVLACGPGRLLPGVPNLRLVVWADPGDSVLFRKHMFHPLSPDSREGVVRDADLLAIIDPATGEIAMPCGEWILVEPLPWETERGGIAIPELDQHRPPWGRIKQWGPGRWVEDGFRRIDVPEILDIPEQRMEGLLVMWGRTEDVFEIGRETVTGLLVMARDLLAWKEE
jgi:chaperonin GroES